MLSLGINKLPAKENLEKKKRKSKKKKHGNCSKTFLWLRVQMMENSQLKLLFEISLFIRADKPFAVPINLNMDSIKKNDSWTMRPIEDKVVVIAVFICSILECTVALWLEYRESLITIRKTDSVSKLYFTVLSKLRDCSKTQYAAWNVNVIWFYLSKVLNL